MAGTTLPPNICSAAMLVRRVERVGKGDRDAAAGLRHRDEDAFLGAPQVHAHEQAAVDVGDAGLEQRQAEEVREHLGQLVLRHHPALDEDLAEALLAAGRLLRGQCRPQVGFAQVSEVDQQVAEPHRLRVGADGLPDLIGRDESAGPAGR